MFIAIVEFDVAKENRTSAITQLLAEVPVIRAMVGNIGIAPYADPSNETGILILHRWKTQEDFRAYLASDAFTRSGKILRPIMTTTPQSNRYEAKLIETVA
jgi:quinol monooxygenase YgiN